MACILKMAGCTAKQTEFWDHGALVTHILGTFDLSVQGHFGVTWCTFFLNGLL